MLFDTTQRAILAVALAVATFTPLPAQARTPAEPPEPVAAAPVFTQISAGLGHTCGVSGGDVYCWGANQSGQLGDDENISRPTPVKVVGISGTGLAVEAGDYHTCAITSGGGVTCWGQNMHGQLGDGSTDDEWVAASTVVGLTSGVIALAAGGTHTCALLDSGGVKCWGGNGRGQLGDGSTTESRVPVSVSGLSSGVIGIAAGYNHTCALLSGGGVKCWGGNGFSQIGDGTSTDRPAPVDVSTLTSGVAEITAGGYHTCARMVAGRVKCWGTGWDGDPLDLASGLVTPAALYLIPADVNGLPGPATSISTGHDHTCAILAGGSVRCWGLNWAGQLGDGTATGTALPTTVTALSGVSAISAGWAHTCALTPSGLVCWGNNTDGQLGTGDSNVRAVAHEVSGLAGTLNAAVGNRRACAVTTGGAVKCWGAHLGGSETFAATLDATPVDVPGLAGITMVTAGSYLGAEHHCALTDHGGLVCWGSNWAGQLGDNTIVDHAVPADVTHMTDGIQSVSAGGATTCAITVGGALFCWGANWAGQVGDGSSTNRLTPVAVSGLENGVAAVDVGGEHTCAILFLGGSVRCWGSNSYGQLGDGTQDNHPTQAPVTDIGGSASAIALGANYSCALMWNGAVKCWGANDSGQLGNGTTIGSPHPGDVTGLAGQAIALAAGDYHACALLSTGAVQCWGQNDRGQLGDGTTTNRTEAVNAIGLGAHVTGLTAGTTSTCVQTGTVGRLKCFGWNGNGELGLGVTGYSLTPVHVVDAHAPQLQIGYASGKPGSLLTLTGTFFATNAVVTFKANGVDLVGTAATSETGEFVVFLDSTAGGAGNYVIAANGSGLTAQVDLVLDNGGTLRDQEGGGTVLALPAGIARNSLYLPDLRLRH